MVRGKTKAVFVAAAVIASALGIAAPAGADPVDDPCQLGLSFLCRFMPIAPGLDHDIDLTKGSDTLNGQQLPQIPDGGQVPDGTPPTDPCGSGCN
jgi:hypothetical protein